MSLDRIRVQPTADPTYTNRSGGPIRVPTNTAAADAIEGLGRSLMAAAGAVDEGIQNRIKDDVYNLFDNEVGQQGVNHMVETVTGFGGPPLDGGNNPVPQAITGKGRTFARLTQAYQEGRISDSYYYARLEAGVRQLRAKYPGYRDQIDSLVSSITGVTPANALRRSILTEIQSAEAETRSQRNDTMKFIEQNIEYAREDHRQAWASGQPFDVAQARAYITDRMAEEQTIQSQRASLALAKDEGEAFGRMASRVARRELDIRGNTILDNAYSMVAEAQQAIQSGQSLSAEDQEQLRVGIEQLRVQWAQVFDATMNQEIEGTDGETYSTAIGDQVQIDRLRENYMRRFDMLAEAIANEDFGIVNADKWNIAAQRDEATRRIVEEAPIFLLIDTMREMGGGEFIYNFMMRQKEQRLLPEIQKGVTTVLSLQMFTGERSLQDGLDELSRADQADPAAVRTVVENAVAGIIEAPDNISAETVKQVFGPEGRGLLSRFSSEEQATVFAMFGRPEVTARIQQLAQSDPTIMDMYRETMDDWFTVAYRQSLTEVERMLSTGGDLYRIITQDENGRYGMQMTEAGNNLPPRHPLRKAPDWLNKLNIGIDLMRGVYEANGMGPEDMVNRLGLLVVPQAYSVNRMERETDPWGFSDIDIRTPDETAARQVARRQQSAARQLEVLDQDWAALERMYEAGLVEEDDFRRAQMRVDETRVRLEQMRETGVDPRADMPAEEGSESGLNLEDIGVVPLRITEAIQSGSINPGSSLDEIRSVITQAEGTTGGYNIVYGDRRDGQTVNLTEMTIAEVQAFQRQHARRTGSSAAGKYQIMQNTLRDLIRQLDIDTSEKFDEAMQDRLFEALLKRRGYEAWKAGRISDTEFMRRLSMEWAGLPNPATGASYYAGDAIGNKSHVSVSQVQEALERARGG